MIEHLKIKKLKALNETNLLNLGKINVICGKNSSGKSTILEGLIDDSKISIGRIFSDEDTEKIKSSFNGFTLQEGYTWNYGAPNIRQFSPQFEKAVDKTFSFSNVLFKEDFGSFSERLSKAFKLETQKDHYILTLDKPKMAFDEILNVVTPTRVLLPPKRTLESEERFQSLQNVQNNGQWLLNKLFFAKNQPNTSVDFLLYHDIKRVFKEITSGYNFDFVSGVTADKSQADYLVKLKFSSDTLNEWIDASDCGLGLRDLLVILYFAISPDYQILLIEEPENHIHPEMQRRLLKFLKEETDKQYFITTHSNVFLNRTYVDRVFFTKFEDGKIKIEDETKQAEILQDIGYSIAENLVSDLIILVEGISDTPVVEEFLSKLGLDAKYNIKTWALGGDIMDKHNLSVFAERYKVVALIDKDPKSDAARKKFVKNCQELGIPVTRLKRYAIENYFSPKALKSVFKGQISEDFIEIDPDTKLFDQIGIDVKKNNRKIAKEMDLSEIQGTDLNTFFNKVQKTLDD